MKFDVIVYDIDKSGHLYRNFFLGEFEHYAAMFAALDYILTALIVYPDGAVSSVLHSSGGSFTFSDSKKMIFEIKIMEAK